MLEINGQETKDENWFPFDSLKMSRNHFLHVFLDLAATKGIEHRLLKVLIRHDEFQRLINNVSSCFIIGLGNNLHGFVHKLWYPQAIPGKTCTLAAQHQSQAEERTCAESDPRFGLFGILDMVWVGDQLRKLLWEQRLPFGIRSHGS